MFTGTLLALLTPFITRVPINNTEGTCTIDAFIQCKLYASDIPQDYHKELRPYIMEFRDILRSSWTGSSEREATKINSMLIRLQERGMIYRRDEAPPREVQKRYDLYGPYMIITLLKYDFNDGIFTKNTDSDRAHAVCVIGETEDYRIGINDRGTATGYSGYVLIDKSDRRIYHYFK